MGSQTDIDKIVSHAAVMPVDLVVAANVLTLARLGDVAVRTVAHDVGIAQATMSRRVNGRSSWKAWEVFALATYFNVSPESITAEYAA